MASSHEDRRQKGIIFNIQKFSIHDGKGIRTLVFLKGCPLACRWCSNPESQNHFPEHAFNPARCMTYADCGACVRACPHGAMQERDGLLLHIPQKCRQCFTCVERCPGGAQHVYGEEVNVDQVLARVEEDDVFYRRSGGGMTLSGGEALVQPGFAIALLREARRRHIDTALETCGCVPYERLAAACGHLDKLFYDLKCFDRQLHKDFTGVDNKRIKENFLQVCADFPKLEIRVRTPVVPGFNDSEEEIRRLREFIPRRENIEYELLAYHQMGKPKYGYLCRPYALDDRTLDEGLLKNLREIAS